MLAGALAPASPAFAHDELVESDPAADAALTELPDELTLTFSAAISSEPGATEIEVTDAAGESLADGEPSIAENVLTQPLAGSPAGDVTVLWKVVSSDGHPISGEYAFTVEAPAPTAEPTATAEPEPTETAAPNETIEATASPDPAVPGEPASADPTAWIIVGVLAALGLGALAWLAVSRSRRGDTGTSDPSTDR
jgi:methionine-rich copper-binding protein CopC